MFKIKNCFHHSKTHWCIVRDNLYIISCIVDQNLLPQLHESRWNTVIRSVKTAFYVLVYGKHYFASRNQNFQYKVFFFFLESKTEDTELQNSVAASEVSLWIS